mmetsp:Transcript_2001/g.5902  ORF Transcript_2001/g.5902 Transcript_2001/m.5902 type:complete len:122 (-) Transcript_2001:1205-1570(-)
MVEGVALPGAAGGLLAGHLGPQAAGGARQEEEGKGPVAVVAVEGEEDGRGREVAGRARPPGSPWWRLRQGRRSPPRAARASSAGSPGTGQAIAQTTADLALRVLTVFHQYIDYQSEANATP